MMGKRRPRGAMVHGCLILIATAALISPFAVKLAGYPPFHVVVATVTLMFALVLSRTPDTRWQVGALAAIGAPAVLSLIYGYGCRPDFDTLSGTSALFYVLGAGTFVLTCVVRAVRAPDPLEDEQHLEGDSK